MTVDFFQLHDQFAVQKIAMTEQLPLDQRNDTGERTESESDHQHHHAPQRDSEISDILNELMNNIPENDAMLAGYRFCAQETIRFLILQEHISPDDPIIAELSNYLVQQQDRLQVESAQNLISDSVGNSPSHTSDEEEDCENTNVPPLASWSQANLACRTLTVHSEQDPNVDSADFSYR